MVANGCRFVDCRGCEIAGSRNIFVNCHDCTIIGNYNEVNGNNNKIKGNGTRYAGNNLKLKGNDCTGSGFNVVLKGDNNVNSRLRTVEVGAPSSIRPMPSRRETDELQRRRDSALVESQLCAQAAEIRAQEAELARAAVEPRRLPIPIPPKVPYGLPSAALLARQRITDSSEPQTDKQRQAQLDEIKAEQRRLEKQAQELHALRAQTQYQMSEYQAASMRLLRRREEQRAQGQLTLRHQLNREERNRIDREKIAAATAAMKPPAEFKPSESQEADKREDTGLCVVCMTARLSVLLMPCAHMCMCGPCAETLFKATAVCPLCRATIEMCIEPKMP
jgi:hypothetical protein